MPILKPFTAPNGVPVSYHRLGNVEGRFPDLSVQVQSYVDREAFLAGRPPAYMHYIAFDASAMAATLEQAALAIEGLAGGTLEADETADLDAARVRRWIKIKAERDARDTAPIEIEPGVALDGDTQSRSDILGAVVAMQLRGATEKRWRCADNVMRDLTLEQIVAAGLGIEARRQHLIEVSDGLWQALLAAQTVAQVEGVTWPA